MLPIPRLLAISDRTTRADFSLRAWEAWCAELATAGVDALQIREPGRGDGEILDLCRAARRVFPAPGVLLVNRRFDIALAAGADGVHLPASGLPVAIVRAASGQRLLVGRSTHRLAEIEAARDSGADFVLFGPVFDTPSKRGRIPPHGLDALARATALGIPVLAVGGVDASRLAALFAAGAAGGAAIRAFADGIAAAAMVASAREAAP